MYRGRNYDQNIPLHVNFTKRFVIQDWYYELIYIYIYIYMCVCIAKIAKRGSMTSGSNTFISLDGIGSNIHVVGLANLRRLYTSSSPIIENEWNCSSGDLYCTIWCDTVADGCMVTMWSLIVSILEVKYFKKSVLLCCWEMSTPVDALFFVNFATVLNKYLGLCLFSSKRDEK